MAHAEGARCTLDAWPQNTDGDMHVIVWTPFRRGTRQRIAEFMNVRINAREDCAGILANVPPSYRADVRRLLKSVRADAAWELARLREQRRHSA